MAAGVAQLSGSLGLYRYLLAVEKAMRSAPRPVAVNGRVRMGPNPWLLLQRVSMDAVRDWMQDDRVFEAYSRNAGPAAHSGRRSLDGDMSELRAKALKHGF